MRPSTCSGSSPSSRRRGLIRLALATLLAFASAAASHALPVPPQLAPADGATLDRRDITFWWGAVSVYPAARYGIQIQYFDPSTHGWKSYKTEDEITSPGHWYTFANFSKGDQGRWRVRAMTSSSKGPYSGWRQFTFTPGAVGQLTKEPYNFQVLFTLPAGTNTEATVPCPDSTLITGGGWVNLSGYDLRPSSSEQANNGWVVDLQNSDVVDHDVFVYVECLMGARGYSFTTSVPEDVQPGAIGTPVATCSKGVRSGGGFRAESEDLQLFISQPTAAPARFSWLVNAYNGGVLAHPVYAEAVCAVGTGVDTLIAKSAPVDLLPNTDLDTTVACPDSRVPLGGGFRADSHDVLIESSSYVANSSVGEWMVDGHNLGTTTRHLQAYAVCAKLTP